MAQVDLIGLALTVILVSPLRPLLGLALALSLEALRVVMTVALEGDVVTVSAGGAFGVVSGPAGGDLSAFLAPMVLVMTGLGLAAVKGERPSVLFNPLARSGGPGGAAFRLGLLTGFLKVLGFPF